MGNGQARERVDGVDDAAVQEQSVFGPNAFNAGLDVGNEAISAARINQMFLRGVHGGPQARAADATPAAPTWEETLTIKSTGNVQRGSVSVVQLDSPMGRVATGSAGAGEALSGSGASSSVSPRFTLDTLAPARVTVLYGVTRRALTLTDVTLATTYLAASPSLLLAPATGIVLDPPTIAAALATTSPGEAPRIQDWFWDVAEALGEEGGVLHAPAPGGDGAAVGGAATDPVATAARITNHTHDVLIVLESGEGVDWADAGSGPIVPLAGGGPIVGVQTLPPALLGVLAGSPPLGSPLQVLATGLSLRPRQTADGEGGPTPASPWSMSTSVTHQLLQLEGQAFEVQEIYGMEGLVRETDAVGGTGSPMAAGGGGGEVSDDVLCLICLTEVRNTIMLPCRHVCVCDTCAQELRAQRQFTCPVCRTDVHTLMQVRSAAPTPVVQPPAVPGGEGDVPEGAVAVAVAPAAVQA